MVTRSKGPSPGEGKSYPSYKRQSVAAKVGDGGRVAAADTQSTAHSRADEE